MTEDNRKDKVSSLVFYSEMEAHLEEVLEEQITDDMLDEDVNVHDLRQRILAHTGKRASEEMDVGIPRWFRDRIRRFMDEYNEKYGVRMGHPEMDEDGNIVERADKVYPFDTEKEAFEYLVDQGLAAWFLDQAVSGIPIESDKMRCPECGNDDSEKMRGGPGQNAARDPRINTLRSSPEHVSCKECGHSEHGIAFHQCHKWNEMSEEERKKAKQKQEEMEGKMTAWQESADYQAKERERIARNKANRNRRY